MDRGAPERWNVAVGEEESMPDVWALLGELAVVALAFALAHVGGSVYLRLRARRAPGGLERRGASSAKAPPVARGRGHPR
jgi:hypothetical protein